jgi:8-amino-3,8-dideoxy-alpha-D-manno-octulosonate transaminase
MAVSRLAIDGGTPVRTGPWYPTFLGPEEIGDAEKAAVLRVLDKKRLFRFLADGIDDSESARLEAKYRELIGTKFALAVNGGTTALISALVGVGVGPGDEVIVPAYTFIATPAAVLAAKGVPVICEVDESLNMDPVDFRRKITPRTKAVIPVHMRGVPARMQEILDVAKAAGLKVVEDAAQANGGVYRGRMLGSMGDIGCFSLQQYKVITAGEGGLVVTDDDTTYARARMQHDGAARFWIGGINVDTFAGENYRISELAAAVALAQFDKMQSILGRLRATKQRISAGLKDVAGIQLQDVPDPSGDCGVTAIFFCPDSDGAKRASAALKAEGIHNGTVYDNTIPDRHIYVHWDYVLAKRAATTAGCPWSCGAYKGDVSYAPDMCPRSLDLLGRAVLIPLHQWMTPPDADAVVDGVRKVAEAILA